MVQQKIFDKRLFNSTGFFMDWKLQTQMIGWSKHLKISSFQSNHWNCFQPQSCQRCFGKSLLHMVQANSRNHISEFCLSVLPHIFLNQILLLFCTLLSFYWTWSGSCCFLVLCFLFTEPLLEIIKSWFGFHLDHATDSYSLRRGKLVQ